MSSSCNVKCHWPLQHTYGINHGYLYCRKIGTWTTKMIIWNQATHSYSFTSIVLVIKMGMWTEEVYWLQVLVLTKTIHCTEYKELSMFLISCPVYEETLRLCIKIIEDDHLYKILLLTDHYYYFVAAAMCYWNFVSIKIIENIAIWHIENIAINLKMFLKIEVWIVVYYSCSKKNYPGLQIQ